MNKYVEFIGRHLSAIAFGIAIVLLITSLALGYKMKPLVEAVQAVLDAHRSEPSNVQVIERIDELTSVLVPNQATILESTGDVVDAMNSHSAETHNALVELERLVIKANKLIVQGRVQESEESMRCAWVVQDEGIVVIPYRNFGPPSSEVRPGWLCGTDWSFPSELPVGAVIVNEIALEWQELD